jgi:hypothetical protein
MSHTLPQGSRARTLVHPDPQPAFTPWPAHPADAAARAEPVWCAGHPERLDHPAGRRLYPAALLRGPAPIAVLVTSLDDFELRVR